MSENLEMLIDSWCQVNNPKANILLRNSQIPYFSVSERTENTLSGSTILGDPEKKYIQNEVGLKTVLAGRDSTELTPEEFKLALEELQKNPLVGCTTVMDMARVAAGYNPNDIDDSAKTAKFYDYINRILAAPFFSLSYNEHTKYDRKENNWDAAIDQIADLFDAAASHDKENIKKTIIGIAKAAASNKSTKSSTSIFAVNALYAPYDKNLIESMIYSSYIEMEESSSKGSDCKQTKIEMKRIKLNFNVNLWSSYARKVLEKHVKLVDDWLNDNSTKPGNLKTNLCIENKF